MYCIIFISKGLIILEEWIKKYWLVKMVLFFFFGCFWFVESCDVYCYCLLEVVGV